MSTTPTCPSCGANRISQERRPNGNATCERGHTYPANQFKTPPVTIDGAYRDQMLAPMQGLLTAVSKLGVDFAGGHAELVELTTRKFEMLADMVLATGMSPDLLKAAMKG